MARRPTIRDVANEAGVSVATVNRVLAGSRNVREETGRAVAEAAARIGYHAVNLINQRLMPTTPEVRMAVVLQKERHEFYRNFARCLEEAAKACPEARCKLRIAYAATQAPADVAEMMADMGAQADVLAATAVNHPTVSAAVARLKANGVPAFALLSDFAQGERACYVGLNNLKVGRGAARMLAVAARRAGKIAIFVGGYRWHGHDLREAGFRGYFREHTPPFQVLDTLVNLETRQLTQEATLDLLDRHPDLRGIYIAGGGMEGAIAALRDVRRPGEVALVVNEVTRESMAALSEGYVTLIIETPLQRLCTDLVRLMVQAADAGELVPGQHFLPTTLHLPEFDS